MKEIISYLEEMAPIDSQESWDNCGVQVGNVYQNCTGILVSLDCTEAIVEEAIQKGCNLIISHHPLIFKSLKSLTGKNFVERTILKAIKNDIVLYAIDTNFDVWRFGVNHEIANRLKLKNQRIFVPKNDSLVKLAVYVPLESSDKVKTALFENGAGTIGNYDYCSFEVVGNGQFLPNSSSNPAIGSPNKLEMLEEIKIEVIVSKTRINACINAMLAAHPYEEVAYDIIPILNPNKFEGLGMIGDFEQPLSTQEFLKLVKKIFGGGIRYAGNEEKEIKSLALCGGSGASYIKNAIGSKVDAYLTSDVKYHEFFDAENKLLLVDIGHFESEQFTSHRIVSLLTEKFTNFATHLTDTNTNPIKYF